jgi:hypothetical protein
MAWFSLVPSGKSWNVILKWHTTSSLYFYEFIIHQMPWSGGLTPILPFLGTHRV